MHRTLSKILLVVTISFVMLAPAYTALGATDKIALSMDRQVYTIGMKVTIAGQVLGSFDPDSPARISVIGPSGNSHHSATVSLDSSGGFTHQFAINGGSSLVGRNTLEVTHQTVSGSVSGKLAFEVQDHASITIQMNKDSYILGEDVILQGKVSPVLPDSQILIQVFNPKNQAWSFQEISFNSISPDGQFAAKLGNLAGQKSIAGSYTVKAFYADSTATATRSFEVTDSDSTSQSSNAEKDEENVQNSSSASAPSKVEVVPKENTSASAAEVAKETVVQSEIKNENEQAQEFTYIVLIKDLDGITVSLSWAKGTLAPNQSLTMEQSWIPEISGEYTAEIFVWKSLNDPEALSGVIVKKIIVE